MPVPSATMATVEIAADDPTRSFKSAADQNDVANSEEIHATKPNQATQNLNDIFPLCGPLSSGTCSSLSLSRPRIMTITTAGKARSKPNRQKSR